MRRLKRALKRGAGRWLARLLAARSTRATDPPERILVLRIDERVGNVLLTTPLLGALRRRFPNATIHALLAASKASIVDEGVDVIPFEKRDAFRHPWRFVRLLWSLRRAYDVAIDASHWHHFSVTSAALLGWTAAPQRITHARGDAERFATLAIPPPAEPEPEISTKLRLLEPFGGADGPSAMSTSLGRSDPAAATIAAWIASKAPNERLVGLSPGARKPDHRVDPTVFEALAQVVTAAGRRPVVLWGPGELELAQPIADRSGALLAPPTNLDELAAMMRACEVVVTNDTGPMHLSVACGATTIALFLRADPRRWGHAEPPHAVVACDGRAVDDIIEEATALLEARLRSD